MWVLKAVDFRRGLKCNWILEVAKVDGFSSDQCGLFCHVVPDCTTVLLFLLDQSEFLDL